MKKEYENIYKREKIYSTVECFICRKKIRHHTFLFSESNIFINEQFHGNTPYFYFCLSCGKTPEKAEKVIIPLLKIMYGYEIKVIKYNSITNENVTFYY